MRGCLPHGERLCATALLIQVALCIWPNVPLSSKKETLTPSPNKRREAVTQETADLGRE